MLTSFKSLILLTIVLFLCTPLLANYYGRISTGGFIAQERYEKNITGSKSNDAALVSSRFYLRVSDDYRSKYDVITDIRDKHDFFDKADKERLQLTSSNTLQVRQLSLESKYRLFKLYSTVGRFPVPEAGSAHTDGVELGNYFGKNSKFAIYGGLNPQSTDRSYLETDRDAKVYGLYYQYQRPPLLKSSYLYFTNAFTVKQVKSETDRAYWYQNFMYQWNKGNRVTSLFYLDFTPRVYLQNLYLSYYRRWSRPLSSNIKVNSYDVITYQRQSGIRERLEPSAYRSGSVDLRYVTSKNTTLKTFASYGKRMKDSYDKYELEVGSSHSRFLDKHLYSTIMFGYRKNFDAKDLHLRFEVGHSGLKWGLFLSNETLYETEDSGTTHVPIVTEFGGNWIFSKTLLASLSFTHARDSHVNIISSFFKLNYRFGSLGDVPTRDAAPFSRRL